MQGAEEEEQQQGQRLHYACDELETLVSDLGGAMASEPATRMGKSLADILSNFKMQIDLWSF